MKKLALLACAALSLAALPALAQQSAYRPPRTPDGKPDLQGFWSNASMTRMERQAQYGDRLVMTPEELAKAEGDMARTVAERNAPTKEGTKLSDLPCDPGNCGYNQGWVDPGYTVMRVRGEPRTSFITSTPNGRMPPLTEEAQARNRANARQLQINATSEGEVAAQGRDVFTVRSGGFEGQNDNPETRGIGERCLVFGAVGGPIMQPTLYNNTYQFVQTKDHLAIVVEMIHDVRVIPIAPSKAQAARHRTDGVKSWYGEAVGWWEGDTLVAETRNFHPSQSLRGANANLKLTERFTRTAPDRILYQFTVEDPTTWTQAWGGEYEFGRASGDVYEYACHEGNYGLQNILAGARTEEREAAARPAGQAAR